MQDIIISGYRIENEIGHGGMATVYLAIQKSLNRPVALKVMAPALVADRNFSERFLREAYTVGKLNHPNIVSVYDIGVEDHHHYIAMEYVDGGDLKLRLQYGQMPVSEIFAIIRQIAGALGYAHDKGFVHRDIKPENILFRDDGSAVLTDFGIAKAVDSSTRMTGTGMSIGTPHYMSPEQAQGKAEIDGRSDLYSLGIVLYEMLTGKVPYEADNTIGVAMQHVQAPIPELPSNLSKYQPLLDHLLAKEAKQRYQSATELIQAIDQLQSGTHLQRPVHATRVMASAEVVPPDNTRNISSRNDGLKWGLGGALLAAIIAAGLYVWQQSQLSASSSNISSSQSKNGNFAERKNEPHRQWFEPEMVSIPGGDFRMGSNNGYDYEKPVHQVKIGTFNLSKYEVTKGQFVAFVEDSGYRTDADKDAGGRRGCFAYLGGTEFRWKSGSSWRDPGFSQGNNEPVVCVSWNDTQAYIKWLNRKSGKSYRLPTEAEWEYAARAGSKSEYNFGNSESELCRYGNVADQSLADKISIFKSGTAKCSDGYIFTAPVGSYDANRYGLHDMHGNVWEWVQDCWNHDYNGAPTDGSAWMGGACGRHVVRGGSWYNWPRNVRSAFRGWNDRDSRNSGYGFRLAHDLSMD